MAKKKTSRKELLKKPDELVTVYSKTADHIRTHQQQLKYLAYAVLALLVTYGAVQIWMDRANDRGQRAYNQAAEDMQTWLTEADPDPEAIKKSEELFSAVMENHGMSDAAPLASALAAHLKFLEKDYPQAIVRYKDFLDDFSRDPQYDALARLALASCYEASGEIKTAMGTLDPMVSETVDSPFRQMALWHLARLYRLDNQPEKELEILKELVDQHPNSPFYAMAQARL